MNRRRLTGLLVAGFAGVILANARPARTCRSCFGPGLLLCTPEPTELRPVHAVNPPAVPAGGAARDDAAGRSGGGTGEPGGTGVTSDSDRAGKEGKEAM